MKSPAPLPIDAVLAATIDALENTGAAVLVAPPGAGKTTRVAPALDRRNRETGRHGKILLLQPRRVAARATARRIASEQGVKLGAEVGYHVRFDRKAGKQTRILAATQGIALRMLQGDPFLEGIDTVILDEFHERSIDADLTLAMVRKIRREVRPDLRILAMSATMQPGEVAAYLDDCPVLTCEGRSYPVETENITEHLDKTCQGSGFPRVLPEAIERAVTVALDRTDGDILIFLPGVPEIRRASAALRRTAAERGIEVPELFGDLDPARQDAVLRRSRQRKVILATNVAETSLTIENISAVVDTGLAKTLRYDPAVGLNRLETVRISRASADQRAGRAGRTGPGLCLRLWSSEEDRGLRQADAPEIQRVDPSRAILELRAWGESDPANFPWLSPPDPASVARAEEQLELLGATDATGLTATGRRMAGLPVPVRLARLLVEAERNGVAEQGAMLAALLSERDPFRLPGQAGDSRQGSSRYGPGQQSHLPTAGARTADALEQVRTLCRWSVAGPLGPGRSAGPVHGNFHEGAARTVVRVQKELVRNLRRADGTEDACPPNAGKNGHDPTHMVADEALTRAILAAFPDRVAKRRGMDTDRAVLASGRGVRLGRAIGDSAEELFVALRTDAGGRGERAEARASLVVPARAAWLPGHLYNTASQCVFDRERERVVTTRQDRFLELVLNEEPETGDSDAVTRTLIEAAKLTPERVLGRKDQDATGFLLRLRALAGWAPELGLPALRDEDVIGLLGSASHAPRSFSDLRKAPLLAVLRGSLSHQQQRAVDQHAPESITVPAGRRVRLEYRTDGSPVLAARIQEMFGCRETPRVGHGRVRVLLHLLAPNGRPQQVTDDLEGFWERTYPEVRKELRARYPKHPWPEDPLTAPPTSRARRRR